MTLLILSISNVEYQSFKYWMLGSKKIKRATLKAAVFSNGAEEKAHSLG